jgi:hypothetical protein
MEEIMNILSVYYEIDEEACCEDGRWMRSWDGPYIESACLKDLDISIFDKYHGWYSYPEQIFEDYHDFYDKEGRLIKKSA